MTALAFYLAPDQVLLATDTLCHVPDHPEQAWNFCTKIVLLPHLQAAVCGRGVRDVIYNWAGAVQSHALARDIVELDSYAAEYLPQIAAGCGVSASVTSSIYAFGLSRVSGEFVGYKYSSKVGYTSERLQYGWRAMPCHDQQALANLANAESVQFPQDFVTLMQRMKQMDDQLPFKDRAAIGGEIQCLWMTPTAMTLSTCHTFHDYETQLQRARQSRPSVEPFAPRVDN